MKCLYALAWGLAGNTSPSDATCKHGADRVDHRHPDAFRNLARFCERLKSIWLLGMPRSLSAKLHMLQTFRHPVRRQASLQALSEVLSMVKRYRRNQRMEAEHIPTPCVQEAAREALVPRLRSCSLQLKPCWLCQRRPRHLTRCGLRADKPEIARIPCTDHPP